MTPAQRQTLAECRKRGFFFREARQLAETIERIDARRERAASAHPLHVMAGERFARARRWQRIERVGACVVILIFLAVALFL